MKTLDRLLAGLLALCMVLALAPVEVFAGENNPGVLTTDIDSKIFYVGEATEFTFTTTANDDANKMVLGSFVFSDPSAIEKLEYLESKDGKWYEFSGDFGPAGGFPMSDATSTFRVTFNKAGSFTVTATMKLADGTGDLCTVQAAVTVSDYKPSQLSTDIGAKAFKVGQTTEFTFTTTANGDANRMVLGSFVFSDPSAIEKLEYLESRDGKWYEFSGDFGPAGGFPMSDATITFRATFKKAGTYSLTASMKAVEDGTILCSTSQSVTVAEKVNAILTSDIGSKTFAVGDTTEFTFTTTANDYAGTMVLGAFEFSDPTAIAKLEYLESRDGNWYEFSGEFGPAGGFPLIDGTSTFRVTFSKAGDYTVTAYMKRADNGETLCTTGAITVNVLAKYRVTVSSNVAEGGTISPADEAMVNAGGTAEFTVVANEGYQIDSIRGATSVDIAEDKLSATVTVTPESDVDVVVNFVLKSYSIEVNADIKNGSVEIDETGFNVDGTVNHGTAVKVYVTPEAGYRLAALTVTGTDYADTLDSGDIKLDENGRSYIEIIVKEDLNIGATFTIKKYTITVDESIKNGTVSVDITSADHGQKVTITAVPHDSYDLDWLKVNGNVCTLELVDGVYKLTMEVTSNLEIAAAFKHTDDVVLGDYVSLSTTGLVRNKGNLYVYDSDAKATMTLSSNDKIRIIDGENNLVVESTYNGNIHNLLAQSILDKTQQENVWINGSQYILQVNTGKGDWDWHTVKDLADNKALIIAFDGDKDDEKPSVVCDILSEAKNNVYGSNVVIAVTATELEEYYSGIKSIHYAVGTEMPDESVEWRVIYNPDLSNGGGPKASGEFTVDAKDNSYETVYVSVKVEDFAGNITVETMELCINAIVPEVTVQVNGVQSQDAVENYYNGSRTATVTITDKDYTFVQDNVRFIIEDEDGNNLLEAVDGKKYVDIKWNGQEATIEFLEDGTYIWKVEYTNLVGLQAAGAHVIGMNPWEFVIDRQAPKASVAYKTSTWDVIAETLTFGLWSNSEIVITALSESADAQNGKTMYYKSSGEVALDNAQLNKLYEEGHFTRSVITVNSDEKFVIYARIVDKAGNVTYVSTQGLGYDDELGKIEFALHDEANSKGYYNDDVGLTFTVKDIAVDGVYSGLEKIMYQIFSGQKMTQDGVVSDLQGIIEYEWKITVDSEKNNSDDVTVVVTAWDRAGNQFSDNLMLRIDATAPDIELSYNNNAHGDAGFYRGDRTAKIVVTERNFDANGVKIEITKDGKPVDDYEIRWTERKGTAENSDDTTHTAEIVYHEDGDYTFAIEYTDLAGNKASVAPAEGTNDPYTFTIDQTNPIVRVSYNNNEAVNGNYFKAARTATVTITEHNFDVKRVVFNQTANRGGATPNVTWQHNGDTHIATINYTVDGDYSFDVTMTDRAGNNNGVADFGHSVAGRDFVIDTTFENMITIGGVENGKAYGYSDDVIPTVDVADINLDECTVTLIGVQKDKTIDLTETVSDLLHAGEGKTVGTFDIFEVIQDMDGIYTLTVNSRDMAGNQDVEKVTFTVNRFGSVYVYDDYLLDLIAGGGAYVQSVTADLIIVEYNSDKLVSDSLVIEITCDGKPLENVIYEVTPEINDTVAVGESGWYQYKYTISKDNFTSDGTYKISVSTKDATGNNPENNNYEDMGITFRVDGTLAEISSVVGLEEEIINATEQMVKYTVYDTMGIKSIKIHVNGELVDEITDFSADLNNYSGSFTLTEQGAAQSVRIVVEDLAGNVTDTDAEIFSSAYAFNKSVTVSTNIFVRWYANKPLFWGSIGGVTVVAAGLWTFLAAKRKKKEGATPR